MKKQIGYFLMATWCLGVYFLLAYTIGVPFFEKHSELVLNVLLIGLVVLAIVCVSLVIQTMSESD